MKIKHRVNSMCYCFLPLSGHETSNQLTEGREMFTVENQLTKELDQISEGIVVVLFHQNVTSIRFDGLLIYSRSIFVERKIKVLNTFTYDLISVLCNEDHTS
ncbi:hypothetical protein KC19_2G179600 [Ceratodon purpureus]|uniref:Uncharacterized protein n=1 Tax=Ceratodon purpureus TaxID=3225 RepID=A0A8T0IV89_CERPU|nr:hypothetical protein KC19_2G179600 [Ceratodon purpureus]